VLVKWSLRLLKRIDWHASSVRGPAVKCWAARIFLSATGSHCVFPLPVGTRGAVQSLREPVCHRTLTFHCCSTTFGKAKTTSLKLRLRLWERCSVAWTDLRAHSPLLNGDRAKHLSRCYVHHLPPRLAVCSAPPAQEPSSWLSARNVLMTSHSLTRQLTLPPAVALDPAGSADSPVTHEVIRWSSSPLGSG
jgi:hypothetical protein